MGVSIPSSGQYCPAGQARQTVAPVEGEYVPFAHAIGTDRPTVQYLPLGQVVGSNVPVEGQNQPAGHAVHSDLPDSSAYVPETHVEHVEELGPAQDPGWQMLQSIMMSPSSLWYAPLPL